MWSGVTRRHGLPDGTWRPVLGNHSFIHACRFPAYFDATWLVRHGRGDRRASCCHDLQCRCGVSDVAAPASAFAHNRVHNAALHAVVDGLTFAVVTAPLWTAYLWVARRRGALLRLVAVVQVPAAVIGFVPMASPGLHVGLLVSALALTGSSLWLVRRHTRGVAASAVVSG